MKKSTAFIATVLMVLTGCNDAKVKEEVQFSKDPIAPQSSSNTSDHTASEDKPVPVGAQKLAVEKLKSHGVNPDQGITDADIRKLLVQ